jgi:tRNA threonylcarbamoyladenosine biosynthesis protein TsaE
MAQITLSSLSETCRLGVMLAEGISCCGIAALLLRGPLGSGKTTLTRAIVESLPGGDIAEVASPSFTICNQYPTTPQILHCDLYRCPNSLPDEVLDGLDNPKVLTVLEWSEYLPEAEIPQDYLDILLQPCEESRRLTLQAHGKNAAELLRHLRRNWPME